MAVIAEDMNLINVIYEKNGVKICLLLLVEDKLWIIYMMEQYI